MLKKGQPGWIDNVKRPEPEPRDYVRVPHKSKGKKRFGLYWKARPGYRWQWHWKQWYHTAKDRDEAAKALSRKSWLTKNHSLEKIER